jgi:hypothetical protein
MSQGFKYIYEPAALKKKKKKKKKRRLERVGSFFTSWILKVKKKSA